MSNRARIELRNSAENRSNAKCDSTGLEVVVVGGGILGMYLALRLRDAGIGATILEGAPHTGGLASPAEIGPVKWDKYYHVILNSDEHLLALVGRLGLTQELRWGITKTGFYADGRLVSMSNAVEFLRFPILNLIDKARLGGTIFYASRIRNWQALEAVLAVDWLKKWSGQRVFDKIWLPLLKSKLGENYKLASASFIWAIIARMYSARRVGLKQEQFGYVNGGYATILGRLQRELDNSGVKTETGANVKRVESENGGVILTLADGSFRRFGHAIMTVPTNTIGETCAQLTADEKARLKSVVYQGIICPSFLLSEPISPYYVTNITDKNVPFTGVIEMTALVDRRNFDGNTLVYLPWYLTQDSDTWNKDDAEIFEECINALEHMYPRFRRSHVIAKNIARARRVLAVSTLDYTTKYRPAVDTSLANVSILNSAQIANGTLNVNETLGVVNQNVDSLVRKLTKAVDQCG